MILSAELFQVFIFISIVATVFVSAAWFLVEETQRRLTRASAPLAPGQIRLRRAIWGLAVLGGLCIAYGRLVEPYWLEVTHVRIESPKIPRGTRPIRIVHFSDLHSDPKPRLEDRLPAVIAAERPDLIVFTGDAANSREGIPVFRDCMKRIAAIAPTFAVRGNWDVAFWDSREDYGGTGVRVLEYEHVKIQVAGADLWVAGLPYGQEADLNRAFAGIPSDAFTLLVYHTPDIVEEGARLKVDLLCSGHTHGGQVALPFYGALVTFSRHGKKYEAGLYRLGGISLYVNRGIGMEGASVPRVRFCARPEVTVIEIVGTK